MEPDAPSGVRPFVGRFHIQEFEMQIHTPTLCILTPPFQPMKMKGWQMPSTVPRGYARQPSVATCTDASFTLKKAARSDWLL